MWVPPEDKDPVCLHAPTRKSVGLFGAVRLGNGQCVTRRETTFSGETFGGFLEQLRRHRRRGTRMILIADNSKYHHARILRPWLAAHRRELRLDFLPPYSPDLNPIERVWKLTRRLCTHNQYFPTLDLLVERVCEQFEDWEAPNETLRRLCAIS
jgi:transposase